MDEREKLRKFRELDDAFADALRELDDPNSQLDIPTGPPVRSLEEQERNREAAAQQAFESRLHTLMQEYGQPAENVCQLLQTLKSLARIA
ncbi:hypothetical protein GCM10017767_02160 [Halomonas urumqiensis]|nr:hypothetical protein GCM10017767_02160 [Halomonas urumqiensis]